MFFSSNIMPDKVSSLMSTSQDLEQKPPANTIAICKLQAGLLTIPRTWSSQSTPVTPAQDREKGCSCFLVSILSAHLRRQRGLQIIFAFPSSSFACSIPVTITSTTTAAATTTAFFGGSGRRSRP